MIYAIKVVVDDALTETQRSQLGAVMPAGWGFHPGPIWVSPNQEQYRIGAAVEITQEMCENLETQLNGMTTESDPFLFWEQSPPEGWLPAEGMDP